MYNSLKSGLTISEEMKEEDNVRNRPITSSTWFGEDSSIVDLYLKEQFRRLIGLCRRFQTS
jgi:hypothetical protein